MHEANGRHRDIIVVGGSAGAIEAMTSLLKRLPGSLPAAIFLIIHVSPDARSLLPTILGRAGSLAAGHYPDGEPIVPGRLYIAPPDHHLVVRPGHIHLSRGPKENGYRPAADTLFRSASYYYGDRVIGVVLSGNLDDGTAGLRSIKANGGVTMVLDPNDALYSGMPRSAIEGDHPDYVMSVSDMGQKIQELVAEPLWGKPTERQSGSEELVAQVNGLPVEAEPPGEPSGFTCPECNGALWQHGNGGGLHYQCRTGHAFSPQSLFAKQTQVVEDALWAALAALEERASLAGRIAERAQVGGRFVTANRYSDERKTATEHAAVIRELLYQPVDSNPADPQSEDELKVGTLTDSGN